MYVWDACKIFLIISEFFEVFPILDNLSLFFLNCQNFVSEFLIKKFSLKFFQLCFFKNLFVESYKQVNLALMCIISISYKTSLFIMFIIIEV